VAADERDVVIAVANSTRYGGAGGSIATLSMHSSAIELTLHEMGHTAFKLADEYNYGTCSLSEPSETNVTTEYRRAYIKWRDLIASSTPVPTPAGSVRNGTVGLFQGGKYCTGGMYRPTENSRMNELYQPWHAVNDRQIDLVLAKYSGNSNNFETTSGTLAAGARLYGPDGSWRQITNRGDIQLELSGAGGTDWDIYLQRWDGQAWQEVARANGSSNIEKIQYSATSGYYRYQIHAYSGGGNYQLKFRMPK
jgi:hypothetical protein